MAEAASAGATPAQERATIRYGVYSQVGSYVGKTVKQVRDELANQWGVPADAQAFQGKQKLDDDTVITAGMSIEFHRRQLGALQPVMAAA